MWYEKVTLFRTRVQAEWKIAARFVKSKVWSNKIESFAVKKAEDSQQRWLERCLQSRGGVKQLFDNCSCRKVHHNRKPRHRWKCLAIHGSVGILSQAKTLMGISAAASVFTGHTSVVYTADLQFKGKLSSFPTITHRTSAWPIFFMGSFKRTL